LAIGLDVVEEGFYLVELHLVLHRPNRDLRVEAIAQLLLPGVIDERLHEVLVERAVDIESFDTDAPLARVPNAPQNNCGMIDV
jgi:hypothetical protein